MQSRSKAHEITNNGLSIEDGPWIIGGSSDPLLIPVDGPTRYFRDNGEEWFNNGSGWQQIVSSGFDIDLVLVDYFFEVLTDELGNILLGV